MLLLLVLFGSLFVMGFFIGFALLLQVAVAIAATWIVHSILYSHLGATEKQEDLRGCFPILLIPAGVALSILGWIWGNFLFWIGPTLLGAGIGLSHEWHQHVCKRGEEKQKALSETQQAKKKGRLY
ncbi:hypothetical protein KAX17_18170 [Candidatus Bipolaricaulota bacterium]|nr:hypothetical protein [Candidatus Bipolaricaulota bacterium]